MSSRRARTQPNRVAVTVEIPESMTVFVTSPAIVPRRIGTRYHRFLEWKTRRRPKVIHGTPQEAFIDLLNVDFDSDEAVLSFARRWGPFINHHSFEEQWNADEVVEALSHRIPLRAKARREVEEVLQHAPDDSVDLDRIAWRRDNLLFTWAHLSAADWSEVLSMRLPLSLREVRELRERGNSGSVPVPSAHHRYLTARVLLQERLVEPLPEELRNQFLTDSPVSPRIRGLMFRPPGGYGALEYAGLGMLLTALEGREVFPCVVCKRAFEPSRRRVDFKYCSYACGRLAAKDRRRARGSDLK